MTVALVANIARPISSAISTAFSDDSYGLLSSYGLLGASANPDAVIEALFANSEVGAWYDPSDLTTMFQDSTGTNPVTADGQPVGLILDKSKGLVLGSELVTNGDFSNGTTVGWTTNYGTGTTSVVSGRMKMVISGASYVNEFIITGLVVGKTYKVTCDIWAYTAAETPSNKGRIQLVGSSSGFLSATIGAPSKTRIFVAGSTQLNLQAGVASESAWGAVGDYAEFDNISVKELPGNHASQATDASRPLKTSTGAADWTNYDAVDDVLNTTFPSSLGSSCTVCRANVGAAPTILTEQTIGTSYADSTDNAGLIIINRALTGQETTDVTAWLLTKGAT